VAIFLGIDGGGSKTTCVVADESTVLATATVGGINLVRSGEAQARSNLHEVIRQACASARIEPSQITRVCLGTTGAGRPQAREVLQRIVAEVVPAEVQIFPDTVIALYAAFENGEGIVVIAGAGSIAYGRNHRGETARAGGWGYAISDEGSGQWIGRTAVSAALRSHDEGESSRVFHLVCKAWGLETLDDLIRAANNVPPPDFFALVPHVLEAADAGDAVARAVLTQAGTELATIVKIVIGRIFADRPNVPVAMSGGVFRNSPLVRQVFYNSLRSEYPDVKIAPTVVEPVKGALALARQGMQST
jgi:N-acetylglucosamine kinase-like BadF-type ATPase